MQPDPNTITTATVRSLRHLRAGEATITRSKPATVTAIQHRFGGRFRLKKFILIDPVSCKTFAVHLVQCEQPLKEETKP